MNDISERIIKLIRESISDEDLSKKVINLDDNLYQSGLGLDSLDTATLSAKLEQEFGKDPYSIGVFPRTVKEIIDFYSN